MIGFGGGKPGARSIYPSIHSSTYPLKTVDPQAGGWNHSPPMMAFGHNYCSFDAR